MRIRELTNTEFTNFADNYPIHSIYQTAEYALVMNNQDTNSFFLGLVDDFDNIIGATLILVENLFGFKYAYAPHGFLIDYNNKELVNTFTKEIKKYLGSKNIMGIKLNPKIIKNISYSKSSSKEINYEYDNIFKTLQNLGYYHFGYNNYFEALKPRFEAVIDINIPYYLIFNNISKNFRTKIRNAEKIGIKIFKGNENDLSLLYEHTKRKYKRDIKYFEDAYKYFSKRNMIDIYYARLNTTKYITFTQKEYEEAQQLSNFLEEEILTKISGNEKLIKRKIIADTKLDDSKNKLIEATNLLKNNPNGIDLASILVIKYRDTVYLLMDGYNPTYQKFNGKHLLLWKVIEKYAKEGYKRFSLGGVINPESKNKKFEGLNEFKLNFGAKIYEYAGDFELITNNTQYFMYRNSAPIRNILKR